MKNIKEPWLLLSTFPSGRWVMTSQDREILTSECDAEKTREFALKNDYLARACAPIKGFNWSMLAIPIEHETETGDHPFTDQGNRLTFDRVEVTDHDLCLALVHAQHKFGNQLTLTGDDPVLTARMAALADDMGLTYKIVQKPAQ